MHSKWVNTQRTSTKRTKSWFCKLVEHGDDNAESAEDEYCDEVDKLWSESTVEAVVEPRHE